VKTALNLVRAFSIGGIAHITGEDHGESSEGDPQRFAAPTFVGDLDVPLIFPFLKERGKISEEEMFRTFNNASG